VSMSALVAYPFPPGVLAKEVADLGRSSAWAAPDPPHYQLRVDGDDCEHRHVGIVSGWLSVDRASEVPTELICTKRVDEIVVLPRAKHDRQVT